MTLTYLDSGRIGRWQDQLERGTRAQTRDWLQFQGATGVHGFKVLGKLEDRNWVVKQSYDQLWLYFECVVRKSGYEICLDGRMDDMDGRIGKLCHPRSVFAKGDETTLAVSYQQLPTAVKPGLILFVAWWMTIRGLQTPNQSMFQFNWNLYLDQLAQSISITYVMGVSFTQPNSHPPRLFAFLSLSLSRSLSASDSISMWNLQGFNMNHWPTGGSIILAADGSLSLKVKSCGSDHVVTEAEPLSEIFSWRYPKGLSQSIF